MTPIRYGTFVRAAATACFITASMSAAHAAIVTGPALNFHVSTEVMDQEGGTSTSRTNTLLGTVQAPRFDPALGVLTGATVHVTGERRQSVTVTGQGNARKPTTLGVGSSTARVEAAGVTATFSQIGATGSCTAAMNCTATTVVAAVTTATSIGVSSNRLADWSGTGSMGLNLWAPLVSATQINDNFTGVERTTYGLQWTGALSVDYSYRQHALASFDGVGQPVWDIDFGTYRRGAAVDPRAFHVFNGAGDRVGLDLDAVMGDGDTSVLLTDLNLFDDLTAGSKMGFLAFFDTSAAGDYRATYRLSLSNTGLGESAGIDPVQSLLLTLRGRVEEPPSLSMQVPEPGSLSLVALGAVVLMLGGRRRSR